MQHKIVEGILSGDRRMVARAISLVEDDSSEKENILSAIYPFTGGAILGDRIRMQEHALDKGVFIRSMGTRGSLGGLSRATKDVVQILDAFGKDVVIIETVGVGQSEVDIIKYADTTVVVLTPAGGDSVQTIKAGIMEIADVFVVNKADLPGADRTVSEISMMLDLGGKARAWRPPIVRTITLDGAGVGELYQALLNHREFLTVSGQIEKARKERVRRDVIDLIEYKVKSAIWRQVSGSSEFESIVSRIMSRETDPYAAAVQILGNINLGALSR
jgi:LAO/AO transport system kinase